MESLSNRYQISILEYFSGRKGLCEPTTWLCKERCGEQVCHLKKALYELKQVPRVWYSRIDGYFMKNSSKRCHFEYTLYVKEGDQGKFLMVYLYIDDLIFTGHSISIYDEFKKTSMCEFEMNDIGSFLS